MHKRSARSSALPVNTDSPRFLIPSPSLLRTDSHMYTHTFPSDIFQHTAARSQSASSSSALFQNLSPADDIIMQCQCVTSREPGCISRINMHSVGGWEGRWGVGGACPQAANAYSHSVCCSAAPLVLGSHHIVERQPSHQAIRANALCPSPLPPPPRSPPLPPPPHGGAFQEALNFLMQRIYLSSVMTALRILFGRLMLASGLIGLNQADILL